MWWTEVAIIILSTLWKILLGSKEEKQKALARFQKFVYDRRFWSKKPDEIKKQYDEQLKSFKDKNGNSSQEIKIPKP